MLQKFVTRPPSGDADGSKRYKRFPALRGVTEKKSGHSGVSILKAVRTQAREFVGLSSICRTPNAHYHIEYIAACQSAVMRHRSTGRRRLARVRFTEHRQTPRQAMRPKRPPGSRAYRHKSLKINRDFDAEVTWVAASPPTNTAHRNKEPDPSAVDITH